jgi:hypothetical protein
METNGSSLQKPLHFLELCTEQKSHLWFLLEAKHFNTFFFFLVALTLGSLLPLLEHRVEFLQFFDQGQLVGLLGPVIISSQISILN